MQNLQLAERAIYGNVFDRLVQIRSSTLVEMDCLILRLFYDDSRT